MNWVKKLLVRYALKAIPKPVRDFIEGHKTAFGRAVSLASWLLVALQAIYPQSALVTQTVPLIGAALGWFITEFGLTDKELRGRYPIEGK